VKSRLLVSGAAVLLVASLAGCKKEQAPSPDVWAVVNGHEIHRDEVEKYYRGAAQAQTTPPSAEEQISLKLNVLDELVNNEILLQLAQKQNLVASDGEVEDKFTEAKSPYTEDEFQRQLKERGLTVDDFKQDIRRTLSINKLVNREVVAKISITDQDVADFYNQNRAQFNVAETQYRVAQIVVTPRKDPQIRNRKNDDATSEPEAKRKIAALKQQLDSGADFAQLAGDYSEDPTTAATGGDVGYIPESSLDKTDPALKKAVLALKPGETSGVIQLRDGYYILRLQARELPGQRNLQDASVQQSIRDTLRNRKEQLLKAAFLTVARESARVTNYLAKQVIETSGKLPSAITAPAMPSAGSTTPK
jgi:peptidyl-prolyl cis-trans isomerase SurA